MRKKSAVLLVLLSILLSFFPSCAETDGRSSKGTGEERGKETDPEPVLSGVTELVSSPAATYAAKELELPGNGTVLDMKRGGENVLILASGESGNELLTLDGEWNVLSREELDGTVFRFARHGGELYTLRREGNGIAFFRGGEKLSDLGIETSIFCGVCESRNGVCAATEGALFREGEKLKLPEAAIGYRTSIRGFFRLGESLYLMTEEIPDAESGAAGRKLLYPLTGKEIGEPAEVKNLGGNAGYTGDGDYVYYIDGIYLMRTDGKKVESCGGLLSLGLSPNEETVLLALGGGKLLAAQKGTLLLLEENIPDPNTVTLRAACPAGVIDPIVTQFIKEFNAEDNGVKVEVRQYFGDEVSFSKDRLDGEFDLILGSYGSAERIRKLVRDGALLSMREVLGEDPEEWGILPNLVKAGEVGGECRYLPVLFGVKGVALPKSVMGEKRYFENVDEFLRAVEEIDDKRFFRVDVRNAVLEEPYGHDGYEEWVDWETGTCSFDDPGFVRFLEFLKRYAEDLDEAEASATGDKVLLYPGFELGDPDASFSLSILYEEKGAEKPYGKYGMEAVLFPAPGRGSFHGPAILTGCMAAVCRGGEHREEAAAFLRELFSEEGQEKLAAAYTANYAGIGCFPVTERALERFLENEVGYNYRQDDEGYYTIKTARPDAERERRELREYLCGADHYAVGSMTEIAKVVKEEALRFFAGEITAEKAAEYIQNRVSIYLAEQG